jgi:putative flavoprotein involved in K+ transport
MTDSYEVIVVGGGQAGLAIGYHLRQQGRRFVILDAADEPAAAWRDRWDSLRLFTPVRYDSLPGLAFPGDPDHYPTRQEVADYLTGYAEHFQLPVKLSSRVERVRPAEDGGFEVDVADGHALRAEQVVVATGAWQRPAVPAIAGDLGAGVVQMHSSAYRRPDQLPDGPALVVGGGNTGYQIAEELVPTRETHLAIGARQTPLPQRILGRDLFRYLVATGLMAKTVDSRIAQRLKDRETLIGSSPRRARRAGIRLHPRATAADGSCVSFADGTVVDVAAVIWATGFRLDHSIVDAPVFDDRATALIHRRGVTSVPGLFFLGLPWQHTRGSALLGWVRDDAAYIGGRVAEQAVRAEAVAPAS